MRLFAAALVVLALSVPAAAAAGKEKKDACALLKTSEIEEVVGEEVGKAEELGIEDSSCFWELESADGGGMTLVVDRGKDAKRNFQEGREATNPDLLVDVDLGKDGFFALNGLGVLKGKKTAFYIYGVFDQAQAEALAATVLEKL